LNFVLRPEISAQIINESYYAMANDAAEPLVAPEILADPIIYPPNAFLHNAEVILPLDASAKDRYSAVWKHLEELIAAP
jgi:spermidine/putrescine-binding protein